MPQFDPLKYSFASHRNIVYAKKGMACSTSPIASQVGLDILKSGGNAMDAAVAMATTLPLVEPTGNGLGSDCFALVWSEKDQKLFGLDGSGVAPMALSAEKVKEAGYTAVPMNGWLPTMVPGAPSAWAKLRQRFGTKPMTELINRMMNHELDFVLSFRPKDNYPLIESHLLFEDVLSVIVRRDSPLAKHGKVSLADLVDYPAVLPAKGLQARNVLDRILSETNTQLNVRAEMDEVTPLLRLVRNTGLYTVLSSSATEDVDDLVAIPINHDGCHMEGCVQTLKGVYKNMASKEFIRILCETSLVKKRITDWLR